MSLVEFLLAKSGEDELLAEWHAERAPLDDERFIGCRAMALVGIVSGEVAKAIDVEWGANICTSVLDAPRSAGLSPASPRSRILRSGRVEPEGRRDTGYSLNSCSALRWKLFVSAGMFSGFWITC